MSVLDMLIKVKQQAKTDDIIVLLDEVAVYEKLAKVKAFKDLRTSEPAKKKVPLLASAYNGDLYGLSLLQLAGSIVAHLEGQVPQVLEEPFQDLKPRQLKQMELMQKNIIEVDYEELRHYDHEKLKDDIVGIFESKQANHTAILIIVRKGIRYTIYQGHYSEDNPTIGISDKVAPTYSHSQEDCRIELKTYSVQGNNAYPFGVFYKGDKTYSVMLPDHQTLWLLPADKEETIKMKLSMDDINALNIAKLKVDTFMQCLTEIIQRGLAE